MAVLDTITALSTTDKIALAMLAVAIVGLLRLRYSRQSTRLTKKQYEAENVPEVSVEARTMAHFPGFGTLAGGDNYVHRPPNAFVHPIPVFVASVKNHSAGSLSPSARPAW